MPLYEYQCDYCEHVFEKRQTSFDNTFQECPKCGGQSRRTITAHAKTATNWTVK